MTSGPIAVDQSVDRSDTIDAAPRRRPRRSVVTGKWLRIIHVYTSMISMIIVFFFAATGLTLNHPSWSLGSAHTSTKRGTLPAGAFTGAGPDYLAISEYARDHLGVIGKVKDYGVAGTAGHIDYAGPGYSASVAFSTASSTVTASITQGDVLAVLNDVHKGRDTSGSWHWVIDGSAILLMAVTVTGVGVQLFQRKRRRSALLTAGALAVVTCVLGYLAIR